MVMDDPTLPRIKVRDLLMQAFLTGWTRSDKAVSQDEYLQSETVAKGITDIADLTPIQQGLYIWQGDITTLKCDAIVNAANTSLLGGAGVDGAIHRVAGPGLMAECKTLNGCPTGEARITGGYDLPCRYVIHTPGPIWRGGGHGEAAQLASCYRSCLLLAEAHSIRTLDFCSISTGVYGYPLPLAATVALRAIMDFLADHALPERVRMVCHSEQAAEVYRRTWNLWYAEGKDQRM